MTNKNAKHLNGKSVVNPVTYLSGAGDLVERVADPKKDLSEESKLLELKREISDLKQQLATATEINQALKNSLSWKLTAPLRRCFDWLIQLFTRFSPSTSTQNLLSGVLSGEQGPRFMPSLKLTESLKHDEKQLPAWLASIASELDQQLSTVRVSKASHYAMWRRFNQVPNGLAESQLNASSELSKTVGYISVVIPTFNSDLVLLQAAIESVLRQSYPYVKIVLVDDGSREEIRDAITELSRSDSRISLFFQQKNLGISEATNLGVSEATTKYVVLLDHDDLLTTDALYEIAKAIRDNPDATYIYSDSDKTDASADFYDPEFKPSFSPILLLSYMYMSHLKCIRRETFLSLGGFDSRFDGAQDFDFVLRLSEISDRFKHIPKILYHWRACEGSTALTADEKPTSIEFGKRAVEAAISRRGIDARCVQPEWALENRLGIYGLQFPDKGPAVTILIPTKNNHHILKKCLDSLADTTYESFEIVVVDNESTNKETQAYLMGIDHKVTRISNPRESFNFSYLINEAAKSIESEYLLLLNDDTEVINPRWLSQMVGYLSMNGVGAVGAKLLFPDGRVQHGGVIRGVSNDLPGHAFKLEPHDTLGYQCYLGVAREYSAVTAACMLTKTSVFTSVGGLDDDKFAVAYSDVDYCERLQKAGYTAVYCPEAHLYHHEGYSRPGEDDPAEVTGIRELYPQWQDRYYNPNLTLSGRSFDVESIRYEDAGISGKSILIIIHSLMRGGSIIHILRLAQGFSAQGANVSVLCPQTGALYADFSELDVNILVGHPDLSAMADRKYCEAYLDQLAQEAGVGSFDIVFSNTLECYWGCQLAVAANIPFVWNIHESASSEEYFGVDRPEVIPIVDLCFSASFRNIFVSSRTQKLWDQKNGFRNAITINNTVPKFVDFHKDRSKKIDKRKDLNIDENTCVFLSVGTVCDRKNQSEAVDGLIRLVNLGISDVALVIVGFGDSDYDANLKNRVEALPERYKQKLKLIDECSDVESYYDCADVFVMTSRNESSPLVLFEAMQFGLPIISSSTFGTVDQVTEGVNGHLYSCGDQLRLAELMHCLASCKDKRVSMGAASFRKSQILCSLEDLVGAYSRVLVSAIHNRVANPVSNAR